MSPISTAHPTSCPACGYTIADARLAVCSECGAKVIDFPAVRYARRVGTLECAVYLAAAWPFLTSAALHLLLCIARLQLGHWPDRWGAEPPQNIPIVRSFVLPAGMIYFALPIAGVTAMGLLILLAKFTRAVEKRGIGSEPVPSHLSHHRLVMRTALVGIALLVTGLLLLQSDPAHAAKWYFD